MRWWTPDREEPELLDWWRPLLAFARRVRADEVPWPVHIEEFALERRADRPPRASVWVYVHRRRACERAGGERTVSDGLLAFSDLLPTVVSLAGIADSVPDDRFVDGVDQSSFLLAPDGLSTRKYHYYWIGQLFSALRVGEYKFVLNAISDDDTDVHNPGGFTGASRKFPYGRLYNLYLDPKETRSYLIRKLAYLEAMQSGVRDHLRTFRDHPPKLVVGLNV